jgi:hypothetical protein
MTSFTMTRRKLFAGLTASAVPTTASAHSETPPRMTVYKDPNCGCCEAWVEHVRAAGFNAEVVETGTINRVKARLGVPTSLASCHTAEIGSYVLEGHVPAAEIRRLLAERPAGRGLAVPRMPVGSPGMEVPGMDPDTYEVILFGAEQQMVFARYRGGDRL